MQSVETGLSQFKSFWYLSHMRKDILYTYSYMSVQLVGGTICLFWHEPLSLLGAKLVECRANCQLIAGLNSIVGGVVSLSNPLAWLLSTDSIYLSQLKFPTLINWTSPFQF